MIIVNTKIYWKFEEEKKITNPLADKSVYNFKVKTIIIRYWEF